MAKPFRAFILYKRSAFESHFEGYRPFSLRRHFRSGDRNLAHFKRSHDVHYRTLRTVESVLRARGVDYDESPRGGKPREAGSRSTYDLVIAVGGDGTVLEAAQGAAARVPVLGVNSDPCHSIGRFCACDGRSFGALLDRFLRGRAKPQSIPRIALKLDGRDLGVRVLNDVLIAHANPAAMSHYALRVGRVTEQHRSSGLWISTAAGSTGAAQSAGARPLPATSRRVRYVPRELYSRPGQRYRLRGGTAGPGDRLVLRSLMREGRVYADGAHRCFSFPYGSVLEIRPSREPLRLIYR